jgi:hypothetical protein
MTSQEFHHLRRTEIALKRYRSFASSRPSKRSVRSVGNATGRTDLKRSSVIQTSVDNVINTRVTYAQQRH